MSANPANPYYNVGKAMGFLDFAIQFTPQYGDSFLEMMRAAMIVRSRGQNVTDILEKTRLTCLHSEPNYGVLWFYHKSSMIDNAIDVWNNAIVAVESELAQPLNGVNWVGSKRLVRLMESGLAYHGGSNTKSTFDEKLKVIFGFEQILPQTTAKKD